MRKSTIVFLFIIILHPTYAFPFQKGTDKGNPKRTDLKTQSRELNLNKADTLKAEDKASIEIIIPGIGTLGELPKIDFGLELLYSSADANTDETPEVPGDMKIRGSLKHRF